MFWQREGSHSDASSILKRPSVDHQEKSEALPKYSVKPCPHAGSPPTPFLDAQLREASTKSRLIELRDTLDSLILADEEDVCIKCATSKVAGTLFSYLKDIRDAKSNCEGSSTEPYKARKKAWKREIKFLAKDLKRELGPVIKGA